MDSRALIQQVIANYAKPIEQSRLVARVQAKRDLMQSEIKKLLTTCDEFFLVDGYNQSFGRIWALSEWSAYQKSLFSYEDWDDYEPRVGRVVLEMYQRLGDVNGELTVDEIRDKLNGVRHHARILKQVLDYDPGFAQTNGEHYTLTEIAVPIPDAPGRAAEVYLARAYEIIVRTTVEDFIHHLKQKYAPYVTMDALTKAAELFGKDPNAIIARMKQQDPKVIVIAPFAVIHGSIIDASAFLEWVAVQGMAAHLKAYVMDRVDSAGGVIRLAAGLELLRDAVVERVLRGAGQPVSVTRTTWVTAGVAPTAVVHLSNYRDNLSKDIRDLIGWSLNTERRVFTMKDIIRITLGIEEPDERLMRLFEFFAELMQGDVYQVEDTDYWALTSWKPNLLPELLEMVREWLSDDRDAATVAQMHAMLSEQGFDLSAENLEMSLAIWPEFYALDDGVYCLRDSSLLSDEIQAIVAASVNGYVPTAGHKGIGIKRLYGRVLADLVTNNLSISRRQFREFLKGFSEVAIVRPNVVAMTLADAANMRVGDVAYRIINYAGEPVPYADLEFELIRLTGREFVSSALLSEVKLMRPSRGYYALREWGLPEFNPEIFKQIDEALVNILQTAGRPLHKSEIRRQLRRRGMSMNEGTLHLNITEHPEIEQVARGVYALTQWGVTYRDLFKYNFPFKLATPYSSSEVYDTNAGRVFEYMVTKACVELAKVSLRRGIMPYFAEVLVPQLRVRVSDVDGDSYHAWLDQASDGRWHIMGLKRWYKTFKPRYGESIYVCQSYDSPTELTLLTGEQASERLDV